MVKQTPTNIAIEKRFQVLLSRLEPKDTEVTTYESHRNTVKKRLEYVFNTTSVLLIGSYARQTSVRKISDVDLLLVLKKNEVFWGEYPKSPDTVIKQVKSQLSNRYVFTEVNKDKQVVVVRFKNNQYPVEVIPAYYRGNGGEKNYPIYSIPDGENNWMLTSPQTHNKYLKDLNVESSGRLCKIIKLLKFWKHCRVSLVPISSFYIEMVLASHNLCFIPKSISLCVRNALVSLSNLGCSQIDDPMRICETIVAANTESKIKNAQGTILPAANRACRAYDAEENEDLAESVRLWGLVFNGYFPK